MMPDNVVKWRAVERQTPRGRRYVTYEKVMPRIRDALLKSVVYLFKDEHSALSGEGEGGTGFLVRYLEDGLEYLYVVTNAHVVHKGGSTLRLNAAGGDIEAVEIPSESWVDHPDSDDISIAPIKFEIPAEWQVSGLFWDSVCPTAFRMQELDIGVGDDVFMLGRFIGHSGRQQNQPLARFGSLAMMDGERVKDGRDLLVDAYLVEMHSLPGFSGSPVFVSVPPGSLRGAKKVIPLHENPIALLGIDTGHKRVSHPVLDEATGEPSQPRQLVKQNSGVAIVAPYYKIRELIEGDALMGQRKERSKAVRDDPEAATLDTAENNPEEDEFDHFEDLTGKLLKVPKKELDEKRKEEKGGQ